VSRQATIKESNPQALEDGFMVDLIASADSVQDIKAIADQPGGQELVKLLLVDVVSTVNRLGCSYGELSHIQMIALCAQMQERLVLAKLIKNAADKEKELDQSIADALAE
jgi:hypothetical protein